MLPRSEKAWQAFRDRVAELGGTVVEETWLGGPVRHRVQCSRGHEVLVWPRNLPRNRTLCRLCAPFDVAQKAPSPRSLAAEAAFRARVSELGGVVLETKWLGSGKPHQIRCINGHLCMSRPNDVQQGSGICIVCTGRDTEKLWHAFKVRVAELGGVVLEDKWLGGDVPHRIRCAKGHEQAPWPRGVASGRGICRTCSGLDPRAAATAFWGHVEAQGGVVLEPKWLGDRRAHRVRCAKGHEGTIWPTNVQRGSSICHTCAGKTWDIFYIVVNDLEGHLKFGVTWRDAKRRLKEHADDGFDTVVRLLTSLPQALSLERDVKATLRLAGEAPVRGREYFQTRALATVLDVVDHYPGVVIPAPRAPRSVR